MNNENNEEAIESPLKWILKKLWNIILKFDIYSSPFVFSYKNKNKYQSKYGVIFSSFIFVVIIILVIDNTLYYNEKNTCPLIDISPSIINTYSFDFTQNFFFFFAIIDKKEQLYLNNEEYNALFSSSLDYKSFHYDKDTNSFISEIKYLNFSECSNIPNFNIKGEDSIFKKNFPFTTFCPTSSTFNIDLIGDEIYELSFNLNQTSQKDNITMYQLVFGFMEFYYNSNTKKIIIGYNIKNIDFENQKTVSYRTEIKRKDFITYDSLQKKTSTKLMYSFDLIEEHKILLDDSDTRFSIHFDLPKTSEEITIQNFSFMFVSGIIGGWILFMYILGMGIIKRFVRFEKYLSIMQKQMNLIDPNEEEDIEENNKNLLSRFQIEKNRQLEIITDSLENYHKHSGLKFSFFDIIQYYFFCSFCKSEYRKKKEIVYLKGLKNLFNSLDIISIGKVFEQLKLSKEIVFEPYQKNLLEYLSTPVLYNNKALSNIDITNHSLLSNKEIYELIKKNLSETLGTFQNSEFYDEKDLKLIDLLRISDNQKNVFFDIEKKLEISIKKFNDLINYSQNEITNEKIINEFEKVFDNINFKVQNGESINESVISQLKQLENVYKYYYDENLLYKKFLSEELQKQITQKKKYDFLDIIEIIISFVLTSIDTIFFIKSPLVKIKNTYNTSTFISFQTIQHCIRILCIFSLYNLYFFIRSFINNKISPQCTSSILCVGFLSYNLKPNDLFFNYTVSSIVFISILTIYSMCLIILYFLSKGSSKDSSDKQVSQFVFTTPSFKIKSKEQQKNHLNDLINKIPMIYKMSNKANLLKDLDFFTILIISVNILAIIGHCILIIGGIHLFKVSKISSYMLRISIFSCSIGFLSNIILMLQFYSFNLLSQRTEKFRLICQFWFGFITKLFAFSVIIGSNFLFLFKRESSKWLGRLYLNYDNDHFICREDQSAENLFWFIIFESLSRKLIIFTYSLITRNKLIPYTAEISLINSLIQLLIVVISMIVFPLLGTISIFLFVFDFHFEYIILKQYKSYYNNHSFIDTLGLFSSLCFIIIVVYYIILRIIFQNQFVVFENYVPEIKNNQILIEEYPPMCRHQKVEDDFQWQWSNYWEEGGYNVFLTLLNCGIVPLVFGIFSVLQYFKGQITRATESMKTLTEEFIKVQYEEEEEKNDFDNLIKDFDTLINKKRK